MICMVCIDINHNIYMHAYMHMRIELYVMECLSLCVCHITINTCDIASIVHDMRSMLNMYSTLMLPESTYYKGHIVYNEIQAQYNVIFYVMLCYATL